MILDIKNDLKIVRLKRQKKLMKQREKNGFCCKNLCQLHKEGQLEKILHPSQRESLVQLEKKSYEDIRSRNERTYGQV